MTKRVLGVVIVVVIAWIIFALTRPDSFRVERTIRMAAAPERIFSHIHDFHAWAAWSPWEKIDPEMKRTHSGAHDGLGAIYEWVGNEHVGQGRMQIVEEVAPSRLVIKLDFILPFEAHNMAEFTVTPAGGASEVTWAMYGPNSFLTKLLSPFFDIDSVVGKDFEAGLTNLKLLVES